MPSASVVCCVTLPMLCCMQEFFGRLNNKDYGATGFFAPKPIFDQRQAFILYGSAQRNVDEAETKLASDPNYKAYKGFREKYLRSRETVTRTGKLVAESC